MIRFLMKSFIILGAYFLVLQMMGMERIFMICSGITYEVQTFNLFCYVATFFVFAEVIVYGFQHLVQMLKNDVLLSNHAFQGDKESIEVIQSANDNKMVLTRNQFDEAAILIVKAMNAIDANMMNEARRYLVQLRRSIGKDAIIDILMLKIYKGEKNFDKMEELSQKLTQNENIQLVGMKAALDAQIGKKEFTEALKTVNQAFEVRQDLYWVIGSAFLLRAKNNDWVGALEVLDSGIEKNLIPQKKAKRLKAVALYELAMQAKENGDDTKFFKFMNQALEENSRLIPAALELAKHFVNDDKQIRKAEKVLLAMWCENPCYDVAKAYLDLFPDDTVAERIERMERLTTSNNKRPSLNNVILAELYIAAGKAAKAKMECRQFLLKNPATQKIVEMLEAVEFSTSKKNNKGLFDSIKSRLGISDGKEDYPKDFQWICANCGHVSDEWQAICPDCGEVGRHYWHLYADKEISDIDDN